MMKQIAEKTRTSKAPWAGFIRAAFMVDVFSPARPAVVGWSAARHKRVSGVMEAYQRDFSTQQAIDAVVRSANRTLMLASGGEEADAPDRQPGTADTIPHRRPLIPGSTHAYAAAEVATPRLHGDGGGGEHIRPGRDT